MCVRVCACLASIIILLVVNYDDAVDALCSFWDISYLMNIPIYDVYILGKDQRSPTNQIVCQISINCSVTV